MPVSAAGTVYLEFHSVQGSVHATQTKATNHITKHVRKDTRKQLVKRCEVQNDSSSRKISKSDKGNNSNKEGLPL